jgi:hypothetical protein
MTSSKKFGRCSFIISCAPESWSSIIKEYHAFSERIFREVVLTPLSDKAINELVSSYLNKQRISNKKTKVCIHLLKNQLEILLNTQGNIRRVLMICNRAIDQGARTNYPLLTPSILKKILPGIFSQPE